MTDLPGRFRIILGLTLILLTCGAGFGSTWDFHIPDVTGKVHARVEWQGKKAIVLLFIATECPISNRYAPTINHIFDDYSPRNVAFYIVHSDPDLQAKDAVQHAKEFALRPTVLMDPAQTLAAKMHVTVTPTVVVLSPDATMLYSGRIDDRNIDLGQYRDNPKREDLKLALDAILAGRPVSEPTTKTVGCFLPPARKPSR
jgi:AhpC/TSA family